jgi:hypothetical protein
MQSNPEQAFWAVGLVLWGLLRFQVVATWRPDVGRKPYLDDAPVFYPEEEVILLMMMACGKKSYAVTDKVTPFCAHWKNSV